MIIFSYVLLAFFYSYKNNELIILQQKIMHTYLVQ